MMGESAKEKQVYELERFALEIRRQTSEGG